MEEVLSEEKGGYGILTLNREKALNAINHTMILEMRKKLLEWKDLTGTKEERAAFRIESAVKSVMKKAHDLGYNVPDEYKPKKGKLGKIKSFTSRKMDETTSYAQKQLKKLQDHVGYEPRSQHHPPWRHH